MSKKLRVLSLLFVVVVLAGCTTVDPAAFKRNKHYAVVSFYYDHGIQIMALGGRGELVKIVDRQGRTLDTEPYVRRTADPFVQKFLPAFAGAVPFKVTYGRDVLSKHAYAKAVPTGSVPAIAFEAVPGGGYHMYRMGQMDNLGQLARDLGVDGVLVIYHHFKIVGTSTANAGITSVILAFDRNGNKVLQEFNSYTSRATIKAKWNEVDVDGVAKAIVAEAGDAGRNFGRYIAAKIGG